MQATLRLFSRLQIGGFVNARNIKDHAKRQVVAEAEPRRQALRFIVRNTALPPLQRQRAALELTQMHSHTRPTQIVNRCTMGGKGRGVFRKFRMARFQFRMNALSGDLPGVKKASW